MGNAHVHEIVVRTECILKHNIEARRPIVARVKRFFRVAPLSVHDALYSSVLRYFESANQKARSKLPLWRMKSETFFHVNLMVRVFRWVVLPASLVYASMDFYFFGQNVLGSMFFAILIFVYSNFLPDLPSIYRRRRTERYREAPAEDLQWYKKYALLLFAPLFVGVLFLGVRLRWKTTETFHNFKSLAIYVMFLLTLGFLAFGHFPISFGEVIEILSLPVYGLTGYLTHLKVDLYF